MDMSTAFEGPDKGSIVTTTLHIGVIRSAAAFGRNPGDVLIRVLDVAGFRSPDHARRCGRAHAPPPPPPIHTGGREGSARAGRHNDHARNSSGGRDRIT